MCVAIRWVDEDYEIYEHSIGLMQVPKTDANTLTGTLKDGLVHCILPLSQCRRQTYDGASNMSGHLRGVAAQIKTEQPAALYVHCLRQTTSLIYIHSLLLTNSPFIPSSCQSKHIPRAT